MKHVTRLPTVLTATLALIGSLLIAGPSYAAAPARVASPAGTGTACTTAAPCSLTQAVTAAPAGSAVALASGTYANATLKGGLATAANRVSVAPVANASVTLDGLTSAAPYVDWSDVTVTRPFYLNSGSVGSTISNLHFTGTGLFVRGANLTVSDSLFENGSSIDGIQVGGASNVLIENNVVRNYDQNKNNGLHADCIQVFDSSGVTLRGNSLSNCYNAGIIFSIGRGTGIDDILVESNFVQGCIVKTDSCKSGSAADFREPSGTNIAVRNNTFVNGSLRTDPLPGLVFDRYIVGYLSDCVSPMTNTIVLTWNAKMCAQPAQIGVSGNRVGAPTFVSETNADLHLVKASDAAIVPTGNFVAAPRDFDGQAFSALYAGADMPGAITAPNPTPTPTPVPTETPVPMPTTSPTPEPTATPTPVPTSTPEPTPTPVPTTPPAPTPTPAPTPVKDTTAPAVSILSPTSGSTVAGPKVLVTISATDNVAVTAVSIWVGTTFVGDATRNTNGSWQLNADTQGATGRLSFKAKATDAAGNSTSSAAVTVTIR